MLFTSHQFLFLFLPLTILCLYLARRYVRKSMAVYVMIAASLIFYYFNGLAQLPVLVLSILVNHGLISIWMRVKSPTMKATVIGLAISANLCVLGFYKYSTFLVQQYEIVTSVIPYQMAMKYWWPYIDFYLKVYPWGHSGVFLTLPLGISFFTFQQIAYLADLHAGRVTTHRFRDYAFCVTFFPHLIAGPIVNYRELIPQLARLKIFLFRNHDFAIGLSIFVVGLAKKTLIADNLAGFVAPGFSAAGTGEAVPFAVAWLSVLSYTFQIYFDFSGYSDMAIGLAHIFGFKLPVNFYSPYQATSIIDFWRRWHITLSRFLRQYVYIPLGGNRHGPVRRYRNLLLTMLIGGLWHGAAWTFVIWGAIHGLLLAVNHLWRSLVATRPRLGLLMPTWLAWSLTFLAVVLAWVFFRAGTPLEAWRLLGAMTNFNPENTGLGKLEQKHGLVAVAAAIAFFMPATHVFFNRYRVAILPDWTRYRRWPLIAWRFEYLWLFAFALLAGFACFYAAEFPQFLYWNF
jgi:D-alanyl-lipoteichoic acid acyltransferase DltB (MBOAT superfamily)